MYYICNTKIQILNIQKNNLVKKTSYLTYIIHHITKCKQELLFITIHLTIHNSYNNSDTQK